MADGDFGGNALQQGTANQILQQLAKIALALQTTGVNTVTTSTTAGSGSGLYLNVTVNGTPYKIALLSAS